MSNLEEFEVEATGSDTAHCSCCGKSTKKVWGFVHQTRNTIAAFFVNWTQDAPDHGATFDLVLGQWGEGTDLSDRYVVSLDFAVLSDVGPSFMVIDSNTRLTDYSKIAHKRLRRDEVISTPISSIAFNIIDSIYLSEDLKEIRSWTY